MQPFAGVAVLRLLRLLLESCEVHFLKAASLAQQQLPFNRRQSAFAPKYLSSRAVEAALHSNVIQQIKQHSDSVQFHRRLQQCSDSSY